MITLMLWLNQESNNNLLAALEKVGVASIFRGEWIGLEIQL